MMSTRELETIAPNYIGGKWCAAQSSESIVITNPANSEVLAELPLAGPLEVSAAVAAGGRQAD